MSEKTDAAAQVKADAAQDKADNKTTARAETDRKARVASCRAAAGCDPVYKANK
jgi:hypothetical protein